MLFKIKQLFLSRTMFAHLAAQPTVHASEHARERALATLSLRKIVAYCATSVWLVGCASSNNQIINNDPLASAQLQARASEIHSPAQAQKIEANAKYLQQAADETLAQEQAACYRKFLVNRCLDNASQARNDAWDAAQIDLSAARLYTRQQQAQAQRAELSERVSTYNQQEREQAPQRARNRAAFNARQQAHQAKLAQAKQQAAANANQRAQNVEDFNAKLKRIQAIKQKRVQDAAKQAP